MGVAATTLLPSRKVQDTSGPRTQSRNLLVCYFFIICSSLSMSTRAIRSQKTLIGYVNRRRQSLVYRRLSTGYISSRTLCQAATAVSTVNLPKPTEEKTEKSLFIINEEKLTYGHVMFAGNTSRFLSVTHFTVSRNLVFRITPKSG
jgi:hypothetical protein